MAKENRPVKIGVRSKSRRMISAFVLIAIGLTSSLTVGASAGVGSSNFHIKSTYPSEPDNFYGFYPPLRGGSGDGSGTGNTGGTGGVGSGTGGTGGAGSGTGGSGGVDSGTGGTGSGGSGTDGSGSGSTDPNAGGAVGASGTGCFLFAATTGGVAATRYNYTEGSTVDGARCPSDQVNVPSIDDKGNPVVAIAFASPRKTAMFDVKSISIPSSVKRIEQGALTELPNLKAVQFSEGLEYIGIDAFQNTAVSSVTLPNSVRIIDQGAFSGPYVTQLNLGTGVETTADSAFNSSRITSLVIPDSVKTVGTSAFRGTTLLKQVKIGSGLTELSPTVFNNSGLENVEIPGTVRTIRTNAFSGGLLSQVTLSEGIVYIDNNAFSSNRLGSVRIPDSTKEIGSFAFHSNPLTNVSLKTGTTVGSYAFGTTTDQAKITFQYR